MRTNDAIAGAHPPQIAPSADHFSFNFRRRSWHYLNSSTTYLILPKYPKYIKKYLPLFFKQAQHFLNLEKGEIMS
jgi:hypothetical protein